jgi:hypothetical protein
VLVGTEPELGQDDDVSAVDLLNGSSRFNGNSVAAAEPLAAGADHLHAATDMRSLIDDDQ